MTIQEAIDYLNRLWGEVWNEDSDGHEYAKAIDMAIEALEKQTPKKPMESIDVNNENLRYLYCPTCEAYVGMRNKRLKRFDMYNNTNREICAKCGQVFDLGGFDE